MSVESFQEIIPIIAIIVSVISALMTCWFKSQQTKMSKEVETHKSKLAELSHIKQASDYQKLELYKTASKP